jgi:sugar/nucleoside kinase (ribokinase family)
MESPSAGLRAVDFGDLGAVTGGVSLVERYLDRFQVGFFGLGTAESALIDQLERVARRSGRLFVVTLAADGSLALGGSEREACPAVEVPQVVDTTGAGDTFAAGFLREFVHSRRVRASLERGAREAAEAIQRVGAFAWEG